VAVEPAFRSGKGEGTNSARGADVVDGAHRDAWRRGRDADFEIQQGYC
jgi:hypothetical protein